MIIGGGVLNLSLGSSMTAEECLEIVKKLNSISQNKFYTINVYDKETNKYLGDAEMTVNQGEWVIIHNTISISYLLTVYRYTFDSSGKYTRIYHTQNLKTQDILSRLDTIEQKLNEITIND